MGQALFVAGDQAQRVGGAMPFLLDGAEDFAAQAGVAYQLGVTRGQGEVAFGHHHVHIGEQGLEKRPLALHFLQQCGTFFGQGAAVRAVAAVDKSLYRRAKAVPAR